MIQAFIDKFMAASDAIKAEYKAKRPEDYDELVHRLVVALDGDEDNVPDPERITVIDHGEYQGTRLFIIGAKGYQPSTYWSIFVSYGSCAGCDTFEANQKYAIFGEISDEEVNGNWTMMLHMVQNMRQLIDES